MTDDPNDISSEPQEVNGDNIPRLPKCPMHGAKINRTDTQAKIQQVSAGLDKVQPIIHVFGDCEGSACAWFIMGHCAMYHLGGGIGMLTAMAENAQEEHGQLFVELAHKLLARLED